MTNSDLLALAMPAIAGGAVLLTGAFVVYRATHRNNAKAQVREMVQVESVISGVIMNDLKEARKILGHAANQIADSIGEPREKV